MLRYYFALSFQRLERRLAAWGVYPRLTLFLGGVLFIGLSQLLFARSDWAAWIYVGIAFYALQLTTQETRNQRLQLIFQQSDYQKIRLLENLLLATPFLLFSLFKTAWLTAIFIFSGAIVFAFWQTKWIHLRTIPTPFRHYPYENIIGFRQTWWLVAFAYFLVFKAVQVDNFNLGAAALALLFFIHISYYFRPERELFVWIFQHRPQQFLQHKIIVAWRSVSLVTFPILLILLFCFTTYWLPIFLLQIVGYIALCSIVLAKYSAYPHEISLPQAILYALSLWLPPLLPVALCIFYRQAKRRLQSYLL